MYSVQNFDRFYTLDILSYKKFLLNKIDVFGTFGDISKKMLETSCSICKIVAKFAKHAVFSNRGLIFVVKLWQIMNEMNKLLL